MAKANDDKAVSVVMLSTWGDLQAGSIQQMPMSQAKALADIGYVDLSTEAVAAAKQK